MKAYRIGKKPTGPWINRTPPIRGGTYREYQETAPASTADDDSDTDTEEDTADDSLSCVSDHSSPTSLTTDCSSEDGIEEDTKPDLQAGIRRRIPTLGKEAVRGSLTTEELVADVCASKKATLPLMSPAAYTEWAVLQEIDQDTQEYPSVDPAVQQDIVRRYRAMHQRVHDEGFYECRYIEYGKDLVRFAALFMVFLVALHYKWYMTSAAFLGIFWVR